MWMMLLYRITEGLDNGLGLTPPMGWLSWEKYRCETNCKKHPKSCINEDLYKRMADALVDQGYKDVGYEYVNIDDCWALKERDANGQMVPDPERFPNGIKGVADYVHSKGLKLGLYSDIGTMTCADYPGSEGYHDIDAQTFAEWEIDSLKVDGCYADYKDFNVEYPSFGKALNKTGRPILYECSWPLFTPGYLLATDVIPKEVAPNCNYWRMSFDIRDDWNSLILTVNLFALPEAKTSMIPASGPGRFNDADMLLIGMSDGNISRYQAQMALWSIFASPLLMSNDLYNMPPGTKEILQNKEVIAVNQDPLGKMGYPMHPEDGTSATRVWIKELQSQSGRSRWATVFQNFLTENATLKLEAANIPGWTSETKFTVRDLFAHQAIGGNHTSSLEAEVAPRSVKMFLLTEQAESASSASRRFFSVPAYLNLIVFLLCTLI
ncbi:hypothetical protein FOL47_006099 [Perkinsus chesapeaki]|uniref:Alpha-galactosidase n=1 Tax=Perkinsus chesapeaki TaxID=330153 RepID=A0A7J6N023_PERCH|nr:hypothetical protein FOL47_006099 [Perkinsus chesapeaki]